MARRAAQARKPEPLIDFIHRASPALEPPHHLRPIVDVFESMLERPRRVVISTPPQHGKTLTVLHAIVWLLLRSPGKRNAYVTYEASLAEDKSLLVQRIADSVGLTYEGNRSIWRTEDGGGLVAAGIGGPLTSHGVDGVLVVDDPVKNRVEAESATIRDRTFQWFKDVGMTRVHPGASVLVVQTRWHHDDLSGRLIAEDWESINLPAIDHEGRALWEEKRSRAWLENVRHEVGEYTWASLYQGQPTPRGGAVFGETESTYETAPSERVRYAIGVDFAYTAKTHADYSVAVVLEEHEGVYYVRGVVRLQVMAPDFVKTLKALRSAYPGVRMGAYVGGGPEQGIIDLMNRDERLGLVAMPAKADKLVRAQRVSAAWNAGLVLVPRQATWVDTFLGELRNFTGVNDGHDDQVDALVSAFDLLTLHAPPLNASAAKYQALMPKARW